MTALIVILCIVLFFALLFSIPIHVLVKAENTDVQVIARIFTFKIPLFPSKKRKKSEKKPKKSKKKKGTDTKKSSQNGKKTQKKRDIPSLIKLILKLVKAVLRKFPRHFRVKILRYEVTVATGDAAKTALLYGAVTGLSSQLFAALRAGTRFKIKRKAPVNVYADFLGEKSKLEAEIDLSVTVFGALSMLMTAGLAFVKAKMTGKTPDDREKSSEKKIQPTETK